MVVIPLLERFGLPLITFMVFVPLYALMLLLSGKIFKEKIAYVKALIPALIQGAFNYIIIITLSFIDNLTVIRIISYTDFVVTLAIFLTLPTLILKIKWKKGLLVGLVWYIFAVITNYLVSPIITKISSFLF